MNGVLKNAIGDNSSGRTAVQSGAERSAPGPMRCFHCGNPCPDARFAHSKKIFCCQGCLIVHDLLAENGLDHFYDLSRHPGVRRRGALRREQWAFLDEPALQQELLDFSDGKISRVTLHIPAIHCIACVWLLENLFRLHAGIGASQVNFLKREAAITFRPGEIRLSDLVALLASIGYEPTLTLGELEKQKRDPACKRRWIQMGVAGFAFGNVMLFSMPGYFGLDSANGLVLHRVFGYISLALALPVLIFSAEDYWKSALLSVRRRTLTLEVPIALGLAVLYARSIFEVLSDHGVGYLDSLVALVFLLLCGRAFQQKTNERIAFDRDYKSFFPLAVTRKERGSAGRRDGQEISQRADPEISAPKEESVSISQLAVGDRILLRNGELIPADSKLVQGAAFIDYSFVTGESAPVAKAEGEYLYAGGKQTGAVIEVEILKPVSQSYLSSLWNHEAFRKNRDNGLDTLTNRYSRWFTIAVIAVAVGAALFWTVCGQPARAAKAFTSVLIVACPCALALAAPFTLGTAQRILARFGLFCRNCFVIEGMARVDAIVFDKTGTLTAANFNNVRFDGAPLDATEEKWVCSLARQSTHPLSARLSASFLHQEPAEKVTSFRENPGFGIEGIVDGHEIKLGERGWIASRAGFTQSQPDGARPALGSAICLAIDGKVRGTFVLANSLRADMDALFRKLSAKYDLALLSGDNEADRARFWNLFGSDERMHFNQKPIDKLNFIRNLNDSGHVVMMVGDGLNDAGALQQSDVGVAVVEKIGAFSPASDVILDAAQVPRLHEVLTFARRAACIVRLSFGVSAVYNIVGVSIAAAGILSPLICAVLMPVSSVSVVLFACGITAWAGRRTFGVPALAGPGRLKAELPASTTARQLAEATA